ncbi:hypothetical protein H0H81_000771 [Sphagnurus paluster]|uniref:Ankyrin repeat domain-containing protein 54 n=1 Tax=Sphagnurus paluster TaxID=117069 RepID=A0A9P7KKP6_9AGAR|nr:hypothetical protein H0H81_000771 [Sphagnurus paluster]
MPLPPRRPDNYSTDNCGICLEKLVIPVTTGETEARQEYDNASPRNREICPLCRQNTLNSEGRLIVDVVNEGGFSGGIDIGDIFDRDRWEEAQPEEWKKGQALLSLCQFADFEEAEELLRDEGVDPNAAYDDGTTGLHMAALNNSVEWASLLLKYGANKDQLNDSGESAFDYANSASSQDVIDLLTGHRSL